MAKIVNKLIPYNKYYIDSAKFYIDSNLFIKINIPENFTLVDADTGSVVDEFKRNSLQVPYKDHKIYIGRVTKYLPQAVYNKVLIYFPAKITGDNYFYGIQKETIIEVLEHLKSIGYLEFENSNEIYKEIYIKDLDIKMDMCLTKKDKEEIKIYNKSLKDNFNGTPENFHSFDSKKQGFGISTYTREKATIVKPFIKFYDKQEEILEKNYDFYKTLNPELQKEILDNFIYRFEFTLKDKSFLNKFGISNRLEEIHEVRQSTWKKLARHYMDANFQVKMKTPKDTSKLTPTDKILVIHFLDDIERGLTIFDIKTKYISIQTDRKAKYRASLLFDKIYYHSAVENDKARPVKEKYEMLCKWHNYFGFSNFKK